MVAYYLVHMMGNVHLLEEPSLAGLFSFWNFLGLQIEVLVLI